jgi:hypothetical protein
MTDHLTWETLNDLVDGVAAPRRSLRPNRTSETVQRAPPRLPN